MANEIAKEEIQTSVATPVQGRRGSDIVTWHAPEFLHHEKTFWWYAIYAAVSAGLILFGILSKDIMTTATFILIIAFGFFYAHRKPRIMLHQLTPSGIVLEDTMHPYKNIKSFWIVYDPPEVSTLNIETASFANNHVTIQLGEIDPAQVKHYLKRYVTEDLDREESFTDTISRRLRI